MSRPSPACLNGDDIGEAIFSRPWATEMAKRRPAVQTRLDEPLPLKVGLLLSSGQGRQC